FTVELVVDAPAVAVGDRDRLRITNHDQALGNLGEPAAHHLHLAHVLVARVTHAAAHPSATHAAPEPATTTSGTATAPSASGSRPVRFAALRRGGQVTVEDPGASDIALRGGR